VGALAGIRKINERCYACGKGCGWIAKTKINDNAKRNSLRELLADSSQDPVSAE
jgi:hypothetical protein